MGRAVMMFVALAALVAGVAGVVAVRDGGGSAQAAVGNAAARTLGTGSSRFAMTWSAADASGGDAGMAAEGLIDYAHQRGRVTYPGGSEFLFDGDVGYVKWPMPWRHKTRWLRFEDVTDDLQAFDVADRAMRNPLSLLEFLTGASNDTHAVGVEEERGTPTTHYEGTLDLEKVVENAPPAQRADLREWLEVIAEAGDTMLPFGLWVDRDGVAHRLRIEQELGGVLSIEYYDFGVPVEIAPPPADEIASEEEVLQEFLRQPIDASCDPDAAGSGQLTIGTDVNSRDDAGSWGSGSTADDADAEFESGSASAIGRCSYVGSAPVTVDATSTGTGTSSGR